MIKRIQSIIKKIPSLKVDPKYSFSIDKHANDILVDAKESLLPQDHQQSFKQDSPHNHFDNKVIFIIMDSLTKMQEIKQAIYESNLELDSQHVYVKTTLKYSNELLLSIVQIEHLDYQVNECISMIKVKIQKQKIGVLLKKMDYLNKPQQILDNLILLNQLIKTFHTLKDNYLSLSQIESLEKSLIFYYLTVLDYIVLCINNHQQSLYDYLADALDTLLIMHVELQVNSPNFQLFYQEYCLAANLGEHKYNSLYYMLQYGYMCGSDFLFSEHYRQITSYINTNIEPILIKMQVRPLIELLGFYVNNDQKQRNIIENINTRLLVLVNNQWQYNDMIKFMLLNTLIRKNKDIDAVLQIDYSVLDNTILSFDNLELYLSRASYITSSRDGIVINEIFKSNIQKHHLQILDVKCIVYLMNKFRKVEKIPANLDHFLYQMISIYPYKLDPYLVSQYLINQVNKGNRPAYLPYFNKYLTYMHQLLEQRNIQMTDNTQIVTYNDYSTCLNLSYLACKLSLNDHQILQSSLPTISNYLLQSQQDIYRMLSKNNSKQIKHLRDQMTSFLYSQANSDYPTDIQLLQQVIDVLEYANYFYSKDRKQNEQLLFCRQLVVLHCKAIHYGYGSTFIQAFSHSFINLMHMLQHQIQEQQGLQDFDHKYLNCFYQFIIQTQIIFGENSTYGHLFEEQKASMRNIKPITARKSFFQEDVKTCMNSLDIHFEQEKLIDLYQCDFYLQSNNLIIEAMGDQHFTRFSQKLKMKDYVKQIQLEFLGYNYLIINCYQFNYQTQTSQNLQKKVIEKILNEKLQEIQAQ